MQWWLRIWCECHLIMEIIYELLMEMSCNEYLVDVTEVETIIKYGSVVHGYLLT